MIAIHSHYIITVVVPTMILTYNSIIMAATSLMIRMAPHAQAIANFMSATWSKYSALTNQQITQPIKELSVIGKELFVMGKDFIQVTLYPIYSTAGQMISGYSDPGSFPDNYWAFLGFYLGNEEYIENGMENFDKTLRNATEEIKEQGEIIWREYDPYKELKRRHELIIANGKSEIWQNNRTGEQIFVQRSW